MSKKHWLVFISITLLLIPIIVYFIFKICLSKYFVIENIISYSDIINFIAQYYSILLTLILGIFVFFQTERINNLEQKDYDPYIGISEINMNFDLGNTFFIPNITENQNKYFTFNHIPHNGEIFHIVNLYLNKNNKDCEFKIIPLTLITRNRIIISDIILNKISIKVNYDDNSNIKSLPMTFIGKNTHLSNCFDNNSKIQLVLCLVLPKLNSNIYSVSSEIEITSKDQYGESIKFNISNTILVENATYYLLSNNTVKINN